MKEEILILLFLLLGPILDVTVFYNLPINILVRGIYLLSIIILVAKRENNLKTLIFLLTFGIIEFLFQRFYLNNSLTNTISSILKFLYLPCSILYFKDFEFKKYKKEKILSIILFTYIGIYLFSYITKIGKSAYLITDGKKGFKGLFNSINEFSAILVGIFPIFSTYLKNKKKYLTLLIALILSILCSLLLGTKVLLGGIVFTIFYIFLQERKKIFTGKTMSKRVIIVISIIAVIILGCSTFVYTRVYNNMKIQQNFFKVNNIFSFEYVNKVIYNDRFSFLKENYDYFKTQEIPKRLLGISTSNYDVKTVEIDIFDILFRYGIIGLIIFIFSLTRIPFKRLSQDEKVSLILLIIISLTSGHVLLNPNVCIYIGLLSSKNMIE